MPLVVDHSARRQLVAEAAAALIARRGLERVTVREIAAATGFSTAVVSHYFRDKRELLLLAYRLASARARRRVDAAATRGGDVLRAALEGMLPLDAARRRDWRVWFAYWGVAVGDAGFAREQRRRMRATVALVEGLVARDPAWADATPAAVAGAAAGLVTALYGIAAQAVFDPDAWPAARQSATLAGELARWRPRPRPPAGRARRGTSPPARGLTP